MDGYKKELFSYAKKEVLYSGEKQIKHQNSAHLAGGVNSTNEYDALYTTVD